MPPFAPADCPHCGHHNRFDVAELRKDNENVFKGILFRSEEQNEEFAVTCDKCGRSFKLTVKGGQNAKGK